MYNIGDLSESSFGEEEELFEEMENSDLSTNSSVQPLCLKINLLNGDRTQEQLLLKRI